MIELRPFAAGGFDAYRDKSTKEYAQDLIRAGKSKKRKALREAIKEFDSILPQGAATPNHYLNHLVNEQGEAVGFMWYGIEDEGVFLYDFWINEDQRRKGFGRQALAALERIAETQSLSTITLQVFDFNAAAQALYESVGYEVISRNQGGCYMQKRIGSL